MIKIQNNILSREPLPTFLLGLQLVSLRDLSWTDPALGVSDCAWLPEQDQSPALAQYERYDDETLTLGDGVVIVTRTVVPWSDAEIAADMAVKMQATVAAFDTALTAHLDNTAKQRRYDNRITCAVRAGYAGPFQAEGAAFALWMDKSNALAYQMLAAVQAGTAPMPESPQAFIDTLPVMVWPT